MEGLRGAPAGRQESYRRRLFGVDVSPVTAAELIKELLASVQPGCGARLIATMNLDHVVNLRSNPNFRAAYASAWRVTIDGAPVYTYARLVGVPVPSRVPGADLFEELFPLLEPKLHRLSFVVSSAEVAAEMRRLLLNRGFNDAEVQFHIPPFGFEQDAALSTSMADSIRGFRATHLILAVGAPKSEIWAHAHQERLGDVNVLCIGAAVEFVTGLKRRAPQWMRRAGFEWLWRVGSEPRRLFKRYFVHSFNFLFAVGTDIRSGGARVV
ncbi:WecB/TagA/CpsF family glycosyltransferase [Sphingomonas lutea]|uniref:WecB/TagA/CpsF family glycosyltransferase n=1 Tax=Sphingomonas lutea TaxID=1045317 RepID=A0A7G9SH10_9SPHN|nr:WecB/TagA/CpsF family glycosyltransferase [Sphingomonas lutea]QNN67135.1 WecB/TagA/CpsF family glycosyltransferase [Sphingomonas lutea]